MVVDTKLLIPGKMLSGEEDGLEDDAERTDVTTGAFTGEMHSPEGKLLCVADLRWYLKLHGENPIQQ